MKTRLKVYGWNLLIALDQMANTILGGFPDETLSARAHRKALAGHCQPAAGHLSVWPTK